MTAPGTFLQIVAQGGNAGAGSTTIACNVLGPVQVATTVVGVVKGSSSATVSSVTDTQGNTWVVDVQETTAIGPRAAIVRANISHSLTATDVITVTFSGSNNDNGALFCQYAGELSLDITKSGSWSGALSGTLTATSSTTAANDLVVMGVGTGGAVNQTFTWGTTVPASANVRGTNSDGIAVMSMADQIATSSGTTPSFTVNYTGSQIGSAVIAAYKGPAVQPSGQAGAFLSNGSLGTTSFAASYAAWQGIGGPALGVTRVYFGSSPWNITGDMQTMITDGIKMCISLRPSITPSPSDLAALNTFMQQLEAAGAQCDIALWHEPFFDGLTAQQYVTMIDYYGPTVRQYFPLVCVFSGPDAILANGYYPGDSACDKIAVDCYQVSGNSQILNAQSIADNALPPKPFGIWEFNGATDPTNGQSQTAITNFFTYIQNLMVNRTALGKTNADVLLFNSGGSGGNGFNFLGNATNQASGFEGGTANWTQAGGCTIASSNAAANSGSDSLAMTCTTAGTITAAHCTVANIATQGMPVVPGQNVWAIGWSKAATIARSAQVGVTFYTSGGVAIGSTTFTTVTNNTSSFSRIDYTIQAPATSAFCRVVVQVLSAALNEVHYFDDIYLGTVAATNDLTSTLWAPWDYRFALFTALKNAMAGTPTMSVINQWALSDTGGYGPVQAKIANTPNNALVAFVSVGSDLAINGGAGFTPRLSVSDDAHNQWQFAGSATTAAAGVNRRVDIWVCPNAMAATVVNVSSNLVYAGLVGSVCEIVGFPAWVSLDFQIQTGGFGTSWSLSSPMTTADCALAVTGFVAHSPGAITSPTGSTTLNQQSTGSALADMSNIMIQPWVWANRQGPGTFSPSASWVTATSYNVIVLGFKASPPPPATTTNPNWPAVKVEAAFGFQPGGTGNGMGTWTDITTRAIGPQGDTIMKTSRGRDYELTQPDAGTLRLALDNHDGAFNPVNAASPYYPNVVPEVPVRVSAVWNGRQYGLGYFYANGWPQEFPDPQYGFTTLKAMDAIGVASQGSMPSAYGGQVLADFAYSYHPLSEFYQASHGTLFSNLSRTNQKPMVGYSPAGLGNNFQLSTGLTLGLAGDTATGIGMQNVPTGSLVVVTGGAGAFVRDNALPNMANGVSIECWATWPTQANSSGVAILKTFGAPANFTNPANFFQNASRFGLYLGTNPGTVQAFLSGEAQQTIATVTSNQTAGSLLHIVTCLSRSGTTWTLTLFINGVQVGTNTGTYNNALDWNTIVAGPAILIGGEEQTSNFTIGQVATYPWLLPAARIAAHYNTGSTADGGDSLAVRIGKLFQWAALSSLPVGVAVSPPSPLLGNADQLAGSALADALYTTSVDEGGMYYAAATPNGEIWYATRTSLYNQSPSFVLGDNGTNEIPFDSGSGFDFSDQFLFNIVSAQRVISSGSQLVGATSNGVPTGNQGITQFNNDGANALVADVPSENEYMSRGPLQQTIETTSDQDAFDRANWSLTKYKQPQLRANQVRVHCAPNPSAFATMLAVEQGDIVTINRRPIGAAVISLQCIVQKVEHTVGPDVWDVTLTLAPYFPESNVLQLDVPGFNVLGNNALAW